MTSPAFCIVNMKYITSAQYKIALVLPVIDWMSPPPKNMHGLHWLRVIEMACMQASDRVMWSCSSPQIFRFVFTASFFLTPSSGRKTCSVCPRTFGEHIFKFAGGPTLPKGANFDLENAEDFTGDHTERILSIALLWTKCGWKGTPYAHKSYTESEHRWRNRGFTSSCKTFFYLTFQKLPTQVIYSVISKDSSIG